MDDAHHHDPADPLGLAAGRSALLREILAAARHEDARASDGDDGAMAATEQLDATASDDDLDTVWGLVESDRLASGLTLAAIDTLAAPGPADDPGPPWVQKTDASGDAPTRLTPDGRAAVRRLLAA